MKWTVDVSSLVMNYPYQDFNGRDLILISVGQRFLRSILKDDHLLAIL